MKTRGSVGHLETAQAYRQATVPPGEDVWVSSACDMCYGGCGIRVHRKNGVVVRIEGNPDFPHNLGRLCAKGNSGVIGLYDPHRVKAPLKRTNPEKGIGINPGWEEISWDEALTTIAEKLKAVRQDDPRKLLIGNFDLSVPRAAVSLWASVFGSPNSRWCAAGYFCGAGLHQMTYLTNATFHSTLDLDHCNYCLLIGNQMGFGVGLAPNITTQKMADARVRGMRLVVVDPICGTAASKANEWVPVCPGTDGALALAMLNVLLNELGIYDAEFIASRTNGPYLVQPDGHYSRDPRTKKPLIWDASESKPKAFDDPTVHRFVIEGHYQVGGLACRPAFQALKDHVRQYTPERVSEITTVPATTIRRIAREFGEAACIGSTVVIDGKEVPYRPVAVNAYRGAHAHRHAASTALAIQLLNIVVGAMYVPGGHQGTNPVGPWWEPEEGADGLLVASPEYEPGTSPYHFLSMEARPPRTTYLETLFPVALSVQSAMLMSILEPEKFGLPPIEMFMHCRCNLMMTTLAPDIVAKALKKIPFQVSFARELDETAEFADIVLPELHYLERLDAVPNDLQIGISPLTGQWYWGLRQPVVEPPCDARNWLDVLMELADRAGFLEDFNVALAAGYRPQAPYRLAADKIHSREVLSDQWLKSLCGDNRGLDWFRQHGHLKYPRKVEERYPWLAIRHRIPLYYEQFLTAGEHVHQVAQMMGLAWDISDYQPLPEWKPCPSYEAPLTEYDLIVVSYTIPFHTFSTTSENPWLNEVSERHANAYKVLINSQAAKAKGIKDGDLIWVETEEGRKVKGRAKVTECVHPQVVGIGGIFGSWAKEKPVAQGKGSHFNGLLPFSLDRVDMVSQAADSCVRVKIYPARD